MRVLPRPKYEELIAAAVRLFRTRGYHATSMQDLADAVGVQRGSLYHYIAAKEDLLWQIMTSTIARLRGEVEPEVSSRGTAAERLRRAVAAHLRVAAAVPDEMTVLHVELKSLSTPRRRQMVGLRDRYEELFRALVRDGIAAGEFGKVDVKGAVFAILGACNWFTQWYRPHGPQNHEAFAKVFADLFIEGLRVTPVGERR